MGVIPSAENRWVLVVDDEPDALGTLGDILLEHGFLPRVADSLSSAKAVLDSGSVGAVLLDLVLRDGNGVQLADWIWERHPELPVLFTSAYTSFELVEEVLRRGLPFFPKPMDLPRLLRTLEGVLEASRAEA